MVKFCAWDGKEIREEYGSIERRLFYQHGKLALYFCDEVCEYEYLTDAKKQGKPIYSIVAREEI